MALPSPQGDWLTTAEIKTKNKCQVPSIDCRGDGKCRRPVVKQLFVCSSTQLPHATALLAASGAEGKWDPVAWPAHKSPSLLFDQDLVVNFASMMLIENYCWWDEQPRLLGASGQHCSSTQWIPVIQDSIDVDWGVDSISRLIFVKWCENNWTN